MDVLSPRLTLHSAPTLSKAATIWIGLALCAALQVQLAFTQPINWDEFRFLSDVYAHGRGDLQSPVQSFHVHLFGWLAGRFGSEIDQVIAGRLVMLALEWGTAGLIFALCRGRTDRAPALFATFAFLSFSFVLKHGASFRYDPVATLLLMIAVTALMRPRLRWTDSVLAGLATGVAGLVTIKAVLYLPLLGILGAYRLLDSADRRAMLLKLTGAGLVAAASLGLLYLLHSATLSGGDGQAAIAHGARKTLGEGLFFPRLAEFIQSVLANPLHWVLIGLGAAAAVRAGRGVSGRERVRALLPLAFLLPLASLLFYRNAFPYFFGFMLAPACVLIALVAQQSVVARFLRLLVAAMSVCALWQALGVDRTVLHSQRATIAAARAIFPPDTPYIDRCSMLSASPQAGFFMSSWGMEKYRAAGEPVFRKAVALGGARYLIANSPWLDAALAGSESRLLQEDTAVLRDHFIHHAGAIWVIGRRLPVGNVPRRFELLAAGQYLIESKAPITLDGVLRRPGEVAMLGSGVHQVSGSGPDELTLRWGGRLPRPALPTGPLFRDL